MVPAHMPLVTFVSSRFGKLQVGIVRQFPTSNPQKPVLSHRSLLANGQSNTICVYQLRMTIRKSLHTYSLELKKGEKEIRGCFGFKCWYRLDLRLWFVRHIYKTN